jgi:lipid-binding SYLF domain-containing protein
MTKTFPRLGALALIGISALFNPQMSALADDKAKEESRLRNSGVVMKEILNIPDDIPQDLLDKAECVIVMPSVIKGAIGIGGSYGRRCGCGSRTEGARRPSRNGCDAAC